MTSSEFQVAGAGDALTVQLRANSSLVSGLAAVLFDILLLGVLKTLTQSLCSTANLYLVYDSRRPVAPSTSRLGLLVGGPVGPRLLSRVFSLLIAAATACVIVIGFSINGKNVAVFESVTYRTRVRITGVPLDIDFDREFAVVDAKEKHSVPQKLVSKRLLAIANSWTCLVSNYTHLILFDYVLKDNFLDRTLLDISSGFGGNAECVRGEYFKEPHIGRSFPRPLPLKAANCDLENITPVFGEGNNKGIANFTTKFCEVNFPPMQCFTDYHTSCSAVGVGKGDDEGSTYVVLVANSMDPQGAQIVRVDPLHDKSLHEQYAANVAFMSAIGIPAEVANLAHMAITNFEYNVTLQRRRGTEEEVSEIDLRLAVPAVCVVLVLTVLLGLMASVLWVTVVLLKGRRRYNQFSTVPEILDLAVQMDDNMEIADGKQSRRRSPFVGVLPERPLLGVINVERRKGKGEVQGGDWPESEIQ